jgi:hypothetical protein
MRRMTLALCSACLMKRVTSLATEPHGDQADVKSLLVRSVTTHRGMLPHRTRTRTLQCAMMCSEQLASPTRGCTLAP